MATAVLGLILLASLLVNWYLLRCLQENSWQYYRLELDYRLLQLRLDEKETES